MPLPLRHNAIAVTLLVLGLSLSPLVDCSLFFWMARGSRLTTSIIVTTHWQQLCWICGHMHCLLLPTLHHQAYDCAVCCHRQWVVAFHIKLAVAITITTCRQQQLFPMPLPGHHDAVAVNPALLSCWSCSFHRCHISDTTAWFCCHLVLLLLGIVAVAWCCCILVLLLLCCCRFILLSLHVAIASCCAVSWRCGRRRHRHLHHCQLIVVFTVDMF